MEIYKAKRNGTAIFLNPDKFDEFLTKGYLIYKVNDLDDESKDELINSPELYKSQNSQTFSLNIEGEQNDNNTSDTRRLAAERHSG